jgi:membrane-bound ClpP family serine protease
MQEIKSLSGYILSIVALVFAFFSPVPGLVLGIISLVMCTKNKNKLSNKGKIMSLVAIGVSIIFIIIAALISFGVISLPNIPV